MSLKAEDPHENRGSKKVCQSDGMSLQIAFGEIMSAGVGSVDAEDRERLNWFKSNSFEAAREENERATKLGQNRILLDGDRA